MRSTLFTLLAAAPLLAACGTVASTTGDPAPAPSVDPVPSAAPSTRPRTVSQRSPFGRTDVADNLVLDGDFEFTGRSGQMPWLVFSGRGQGSLTFETGGRCASGVRCAKLPPGTTIFGWLASPASGRIALSLRGKPASGRCATFVPYVVDLASGASIARFTGGANPGDDGWCTYTLETDAFTGKQAGIYVETGDKDPGPSLLDDVVAKPALPATPGNPIAAGPRYPYVARVAATGALAENLTWLSRWLVDHRAYGRPERLELSPERPRE